MPTAVRSPQSRKSTSQFPKSSSSYLAYAPLNAARPD
jgi:hypothetical protein